MTKRTMATSVLALLALAAVAQCEDKQQGNAEFEQLKVLQPTVGTWRGEGHNVEKGIYWEYRTTISWSPSKKVLVGVGEVRRTTNKKELGIQKWTPWDRRYAIWNPKTKMIELHTLNLFNGTATVRTFHLRSDGKYQYTTQSTTNLTESFDQVFKMENKRCVLTKTNRKDARGKSLPDITETFTRVK